VSPLVIFDFDGTIADSLATVFVAYNQVAREVGIRGVEMHELERFRLMGPREIMRELEVPMWRVPQLMTRVRSALHARMAELEPFAGMPETLRTLWQRGVRTAIVSSNSKENVHAFLARHDMDHFEALSGGASLFGKPRKLRSMLTKLSARHAFYVGDEVRDVSAASAAGLSSVAVSWGYGARAALEAAGPDHLLAAPAELLQVIGT
jgi:phosphoglycolate phosphatase